MSLYMDKEDEVKKWGGLNFKNDDAKNCFYCYTSLGYPCINWRGEGAEIFLYPDCVLKLIVRLCRDVHEFEVRKSSFEKIGND